MFVPIVLTTVLKNNNTQYIVYTDQDGMFRLFSELNIPNTVVLRYRNDYGTYDLFKISEIKKETLKTISSYTIDSVTFYHTEYGELANYVISLYSKSVPVYFEPPFERWTLKSCYNLRSIYHKFRKKIEFNTDIIVQRLGKKLVFTMSDNFYKKNNVIRRPCCVDYKLIGDVISKVYNFSDSKGKVVLMNGAIKEAGLDVRTYHFITDEIISYVGETKIFTKCHPRFDDLYGKEKEIKSIPSYIPVSLLLSIFDVFIGYWSTGLVEAAIAGKKSISTLYIMHQTQTDRIEKQYKVLQEKLAGRGKIFFPKTIAELKQIIYNTL